MQKYVPVLSKTGKRLMPTSNKKANRLIAQGRALRRFDRGLFYIQLLDREDGYTQAITVGIDPGAKKEAICVKAASKTYLNIQADAVDWVKKSEEISTDSRQKRRYRKTPYRKMRANRHQSRPLLVPSIKARWAWKLRLSNWLARYYPITLFVVEDIKATSKQGKRRWNKSFTPIEISKQWFYKELSEFAPVKTVQGYDTAAARNSLGLKKAKNKNPDGWNAHCVDAWVIANMVSGTQTLPDNESIIYIVPLRFHRRQLHRFQAEKGGIRKNYGGMLSLGFKRGSWVRHPLYGVCYVGGTFRGCISLHSLETGKRLTQNAKPSDCLFLTNSSWRIRHSN